MTSWTGRIVGGVMMAVVMGAGLAACADNESSVFIRQVMKPSESTCTFAADPSAVAYSEGILDVAFRTEYSAGLLVGSQLVQRGSAEQVRTETSRLRIEGSEVRIEDVNGAVIKEYSVPTSGFIDASAGTTPGWGIVSTVLLDGATGAAQRDSMLSGGTTAEIRRFVSVVKVFGTTLGGQELTSGEFRFPINVCYGCLVAFPPEAADPLKPMPNCLATGDSASNASSSCTMGQDEAVDCRVCTSSGYPDTLCQP